MPRFLILSLLIGPLLLLGCATQSTPRQPVARQASWLSDLPFVYKMTVQQGNLVRDEALDQLRPGMTRSQVRFLLGTPLLTSLFHPNRWDYTYTIRRGHRPMEVQRLTVRFEDDALIAVEGDRQPDPARARQATAERETLVEVPDWQDRRGIVTRALNAIGFGEQN